VAEDPSLETRDHESLQAFLRERLGTRATRIERLAPGLGTRRFYRIGLSDGTPSRLIGRIEEASSALLNDFSYALLCSKPLADMVIAVIVGSELLLQADAAPEREDLAASWVNRKMLDLETEAQRIQAGGVERLERCERIVSIFD